CIVKPHLSAHEITLSRKAPQHAPAPADDRGSSHIHACQFCYSFSHAEVAPMSRIIRCGLIQARNVLGPDHPLTEIKEAMIQKHLGLIEEAARQQVQILCLQELFYGPYFCAEQDARWYELAEPI